MAISLALIGVLGLLFHTLTTKAKLPGFLGLIILGILLGPSVFGALDPELLKVSGEFRKIALIVILLRAGLGISRDDLNAIGITALLMSVIPGVFEGIAVMMAAVWIWHWSWIEAGMLGFVLAAVSPAVIVPAMLKLQSEGFGSARRVPTMILAAASIDDVVAITIFSGFLGLYHGAGSGIGMSLTMMPVGLVLGVLLGLLFGWLLAKSFERWHIRDTKKVLYLVGVAILMTAIEELVSDWIPLASLMGVMAMGLVLLEMRPQVAKRLSEKFSKVWILAEVLLFVLVGAQVNVNLALTSGIIGLGLLLLGLLARSAGVLLATSRARMLRGERMFSVVAFWPKATVQAAIGAVPLMAGVPQGEMILAIAVLAILVSAPLGAVAIEATGRRWLERQPAD